MRIEPFRCHSTWAIPYGAHALLGMLAARLPAALRVPLALATAASFEADYTGRNQALRSLLPGAGVGHNVVGRIGRGSRKLVLVAHHDAAHTGWVWDPRFLESGRNHARKTGTTPSFIALPLLALGLVALGFRRLGSALLGINVALGIQSALSETVPGASDNATGVAGGARAGSPLHRRSARGHRGDRALPERGGGGPGRHVRVARSKEGQTPFTNALVVSLDTLGAGEPVVARGESFTGRYREEDLALVDEDVPRVVLGAGTDAMAARYAGVPAVSILSWSDGGFTNYHLPTDTADRVNWESVERCLAVADRTIRRWHAASRAPAR